MLCVRAAACCAGICQCGPKLALVPTGRTGATAVIASIGVLFECSRRCQINPPADERRRRVVGAPRLVRAAPHSACDCTSVSETRHCPLLYVATLSASSQAPTATAEHSLSVSPVALRRSVQPAAHNVSAASTLIECKQPAASLQPFDSRRRQHHCGHQRWHRRRAGYGTSVPYRAWPPLGACQTDAESGPDRLSVKSSRR